MEIKEIINSYEEMCKEIHFINERLVLLLNELEEGYNFSPFNCEENEISILWNRIASTRNMTIYKKD